ncbi:MAG: hypothetical protein H0U52_01220 [Chloroflexi bacterium]|nr:hypothetical protein [Chloroflexota bacterium]
MTVTARQVVRGDRTWKRARLHRNERVVRNSDDITTDGRKSIQLPAGLCVVQRQRALSVDRAVEQNKPLLIGSKQAEYCLRARLGQVRKINERARDAVGEVNLVNGNRLTGKQRQPDDTSQVRLARASSCRSGSWPPSRSAYHSLPADCSPCSRGTALRDTYRAARHAPSVASFSGVAVTLVIGWA